MEVADLPNGLSHSALLVIKLPDSKVLRIMSRSVFMAIIILSLPYIDSIIRASSTSVLNVVVVDVDDDDPGVSNLEFLNILFQDLNNEGLIRKGDKAVMVGSGSLRPVIANSGFFDDNEIHVIEVSDLEKLGSIKDEIFDFAFVSSSIHKKIIDHAVKVGGILVVELSNEISDAYEKQPNYRIEYLKRYNSTIVAMRKTGLANELIDINKRRLSKWALEAKKAALKDLEDVLLEPPRSVLEKSNKLLKKIKFLPDLLGDSVGWYGRRVFIDVSLAEEKGGMKDWFHQNYPMGQEFDIYSLELVTEEYSGKRIKVSDWLKKNVKEEEYVVMKVEAEVAEELIEKKTVSLVDEMFLECKNQLENNDDKKKKKKKKKKKNKSKSKRAYWECMALYGRLRDEGVAVHQWWG